MSKVELIKKELSHKSYNYIPIHKSPDKFLFEEDVFKKEETISASKESTDDYWKLNKDSEEKHGDKSFKQTELSSSNQLI